MHAPRHVTDGEFDSILRAVGSKSARKANLVPTRCAVIAIKSLGDGVKTRALLACLSEPLPRAWELRQQMDLDKDEGEYDLVSQMPSQARTHILDYWESHGLL